MSEDVDQVTNATGDARVIFTRRSDGMFTWAELCLVRAEDENSPWVKEDYWTPSTRYSGVYADLASARAEAAAEISWLRDA